MGNLFRDWKLRTKLLVNFYLCFILILLFATTSLYLFIKSSIEEKIDLELSHSNLAMTALIESGIDLVVKNSLKAIAEKNKEILEYYYSEVQKNHLSEQSAKKLAAEILLSQKIGDSGYVYCIDTTGTFTVHPKRELQNVDVSNFDFIEEQLKLREGYLEYEWKNPSDTLARPKALYMTYFKPWNWIISATSYRDEFDRLVNIKSFRPSISKIDNIEFGHAFMIDLEGNVLLHPELEGNVIDLQDVNGRFFVREILAAENGKIYFSFTDSRDGKIKDQVAIFTLINKYGWIVGSTFFLEDLYEPLYSAEKYLIVSFFVLIIIFLPVVLIFSSSITSRLNLLMFKFKRAEKGDYSVRININSSDEIGQLSNYFNKFMSKLDYSIKKWKNEIEERKGAELKLSFQGKLLRNVNDAVIATDSSFIISSWNSAAEKLYGWKMEETLGKKLESIIPVEIDGMDRSEMRKTVIEKGGWRGEATHYKKDGHKLYIDWSMSLIKDADGHNLGFVSINRDITSRKNFEIEIQNARRTAEKSDRLKSEFLAQMSHEIRTPINSILNFTDLIKNEMGSDMSGDVDTSFKLIESSSRRVIRTIDLILNMSEIQTGTYDYSPRTFDIYSAALMNLYYEFKGLADAKDIKLVIDKNTDNTLITADEYSVTQIFQNLIDNAIKYTHQGEVRLVVSRNAKGCLVVKIIDTGIGISEEYIPILFKPFTQEEQGYTRKFEGNGLGLALVKKYCDMNTAKIDIESAKGRGSVFTVIFENKIVISQGSNIITDNKIFKDNS
ncbi:MAG: cache domain-containing protein [Bacteroidetes bacterium]|nr:cache domain-containing protein [Bacteroidota bacterium]